MLILISDSCVIFGTITLKVSIISNILKVILLNILQRWFRLIHLRLKPQRGFKCVRRIVGQMIIRRIEGVRT